MHVLEAEVDGKQRSVSGGLRLQNTQDARRAIDPLLSIARASHCAVLAVARPNRGEGDLRARVGPSVLRQAARCCCSRSNRQTMTRS
jgi:hypothetical protein